VAESAALGAAIVLLAIAGAAMAAIVVAALVMGVPGG
jgi:hypothetical protein